MIYEPPPLKYRSYSKPTPAKTGLIYIHNIFNFLLPYLSMFPSKSKHFLSKPFHVKCPTWYYITPDILQTYIQYNK